MLPDIGVLEVKQKRNNFGTKKHYSCEVAPCQVGDDWATFMQNLRQQLSDEGRVWLHSAGRPVLLNRYHRQYYVSKDQQIRLTVDTQLQVYDQRYHSQPNMLRRSQLLPSWVVMECKIGRHARQSLHDLLKGCPLRMSDVCVPFWFVLLLKPQGIHALRRLRHNESFTFPLSPLLSFTMLFQLFA